MHLRNVFLIVPELSIDKTNAAVCVKEREREYLEFRSSTVGVRKNANFSFVIGSQDIEGIRDMGDILIKQDRRTELFRPPSV